MDLRPIVTPPTSDEQGIVDGLLQQLEQLPTTPLREAMGRRHLLLPVLHALQDRFGWIPPGALGHACERLHIPPAEAYGVATFYALFSMSERPARVLHVCDDIACHALGAPALKQGLEQKHGKAGCVKDGAAWYPSPCLGLCEQGPAALVQQAGAAESRRHHLTLARLDEAAALNALAGKATQNTQTLAPQTAQEGSELRLLARVGRVDPCSLDDYRKSGGYEALRIALDRGSEFVLREVNDSGLVGRGGAAFPTARKWQSAAQASERRRYLVCNADESEPGTFKDRVLMENDPFCLVEAMTIAAAAIGAELGFIYLRAEYPLAAERLEGAIASCRARGLLGNDILGRGVKFDIELRRGAGAYICGEETALFASIEGFRGEPRTKPPFPTDRGLFGCPTVANNVETLMNVPLILTRGAAWYRSVGTKDSPGTRLFCLAGAVAKPGLYELPFGAKLSDLLALAEARELSCVLLGGAAGTFVPANELDLELSFEATRKAGTTMGSGVVLAFDKQIDLYPVLSRLASFFRDESCGQCVPCRVGTVRQEELVVRLSLKKPLGSYQQEQALLGELGQAMRDASICGLGQTASTAIESALQKGLVGPLGPDGNLNSRAESATDSGGAA